METNPYFCDNGPGARPGITLQLERLGSNLRISLPACLLPIERARIAFENLAWLAIGEGVEGVESFTLPPARLARIIYACRVGNGGFAGRHLNKRPSGYRFEVIAGQARDDGRGIVPCIVGQGEGEAGD